MTLKFSRALYPKESLIKAAFQFTEKSYLYLSLDSEYYYVEITSKSGALPLNFEHEFMNEMLSQTVHIMVAQQTSQLRTIIMGRALSSTMILKESDLAVEAKDNEHFNLNLILKDWFEQNEDKV